MELSMDPKSISNYLMLLTEDSNVELFNQISNYLLDSIYNIKQLKEKNKYKKIKKTPFKKRYPYYPEKKKLKNKWKKNKKQEKSIKMEEETV